MSREILPGVHHWTAFHEGIGTHVSSYLVEPARVVVDPRLPSEGLGELSGLAPPRQVVLTTGLHKRDARGFADAFDCPIRAPREARERLDGALRIEPYGDGDEIAPTVTAIEIGQLAPDEGALHIAIGDGALVLADALHGYDDGLAFFPDHLLGDDPPAVKRGLAKRLGELLTRDFDHLLLTHGEPLIGGAKAALRDFVDRHRDGRLQPR